MITLNLSPRPIRASASAFPGRADIYECDNCKRDLTKYFRPGQPHASQPMGPERVQCACGVMYLTGATEWDHLGERDRRSGVRDTFGLGAFFSVLLAVLVLVVYFFLHLIFGLRRGALIAGLILATAPFFLAHIAFWPSVVASMWRTRFGASVVSVQRLK